MSIEQCQIVELPKIHDPRGNLTFVEGQVHGGIAQGVAVLIGLAGVVNSQTAVAGIGYAVGVLVDRQPGSDR